MKYFNYYWASINKIDFIGPLSSNFYEGDVSNEAFIRDKTLNKDVAELFLDYGNAGCSNITLSAITLTMSATKYKYVRMYRR